MDAGWGPGAGRVMRCEGLARRGRACVCVCKGGGNDGLVAWPGGRVLEVAFFGTACVGLDGLATAGSPRRFSIGGDAGGNVTALPGTVYADLTPVLLRVMACLTPGCVSPGAAAKPHPTPGAHRPDTPPKVRHYLFGPCSAPPLLAQAPALAAGVRSRGAPNPTSTPIPLEPGLSPTPRSPDRPQTPTRSAVPAPVVSSTLPRRPSSALSVESPVCCRQWVRFNYTLQNQHVSESITNTHDRKQTNIHDAQLRYTG